MKDRPHTFRTHKFHPIHKGEYQVVYMTEYDEESQLHVQVQYLMRDGYIMTKIYGTTETPMYSDIAAIKGLTIFYNGNKDTNGD